MQPCLLLGRSTGTAVRSTLSVSRVSDKSNRSDSSPHTMKRVVFLLFLVVSCWAQDDPIVDYDDDEPPVETDDDYTQPGRATDDCLCVPFYLCVDGEIVDDGSNIIDPRRKPQTEELPIEERFAPPECGPYHVCCRNPSTVTVRPYEHRCGSRNPGGLNGRILTSQGTGDAEFGEWPWQAAILRRDGDGFIFKCGGTLIDEKHIITIAHCVDKFMDDIGSMVVRLGEWDTQNTTEFLAHEDYDVEEVIIHPQYKRNNLHNDIAVIRLVKAVAFKPHIDTVCLPQDDDDFTGQECVVTGWGTNAYKSGVFSAVMREVTVPVVGNAECQTQLRRTRLGAHFRLFSGFLCAGGREGEDTCKGDGGGPLVCYKPDHSYTVVGLVSWGIDCGTEGIPGVYVNVKKYNDWIASMTGRSLEEYWRPV